MDRERILELYEWADDVCFRHPAKGVLPTAVVGVVHPQAASEKRVRACADCVIALEGIRREQAERNGGEYRPGPVGERD